MPHKINRTELPVEEIAIIFGSDLTSHFADRKFKVVRSEDGSISVIDPNFVESKYVQWVEVPKTPATAP